jgi:hypothetical protein
MIRVADKEHPWRPGMTVADLLRECGEDPHPPVVHQRPLRVPAQLCPDDDSDHAEIFFIDDRGG